jgi:hypothetical protein
VKERPRFAVLCRRSFPRAFHDSRQLDQLRLRLAPRNGTANAQAAGSKKRVALDAFAISAAAVSILTQ